MKEIIVNSIKLCVITLIAGVLLGFVYEVTKEPREKQEEKSKKEAYAKVFDGATEFEDVDYDESTLSQYIIDNGYKKSVAYINGIVYAKDTDGNILGYVITVTDKEGYGGEVKFTLGIQNDGTLTGISFLTLAETAGVGMKADESKFKNQFKGMQADTIEYTKAGKTEDNQIDAISGATVTTNAVTNGVNCGILAYQYLTDNNISHQVNTDINIKNQANTNINRSNQNDRSDKGGGFNE